jgi:hypothetical protein
MWTEIAIALVVIAAAGTAFPVLRGGASPTTVEPQPPD